MNKKMLTFNYKLHKDVNWIFIKRAVIIFKDNFKIIVEQAIKKQYFYKFSKAKKETTYFRNGDLNISKFIMKKIDCL